MEDETDQSTCKVFPVAAAEAIGESYGLGVESAAVTDCGPSEVEVLSIGSLGTCCFAGIGMFCFAIRVAGRRVMLDLRTYF
jgi:hypothetical protein